MTKEIWVPESRTNVLVEPDENGDMHRIRVWENMVMEKKKINKNKLGFEDSK